MVKHEEAKREIFCWIGRESCINMLMPGPVTLWDSLPWKCIFKKKIQLRVLRWKKEEHYYFGVSWQIQESTKQDIYYKCYEYLKMIVWPMAPLQEFPNENNGMERKLGSTEKRGSGVKPLWLTGMLWEATEVGRVGGCLAPWHKQAPGSHSHYINI